MQRILINRRKNFRGGGGGGVTPLTYTGLLAWWKADSLSLADGSVVGGTDTWPDSSGNGHTASQSDNTKRPLFKTSIFGAMPSIRFDGSNDYLDFATTITREWNENWTLIFIGKYNADSIVLTHSGSNTQVRRNATAIQFFTPDSPINRSSSALSSALGDPQMCTLMKHPIAGNHTIEFFENTTARGTGGNAVDQFNLNQIGRPTFNQLNGDIGEICMWDNYLGTTALSDLYTNYFQARWGLP